MNTNTNKANVSTTARREARPPPGVVHLVMAFRLGLCTKMMGRVNRWPRDARANLLFISRQSPLFPSCLLFPLPPLLLCHPIPSLLFHLTHATTRFFTPSSNCASPLLDLPPPSRLCFLNFRQQIRVVCQAQSLILPPPLFFTA